MPAKKRLVSKELIAKVAHGVGMEGFDYYFNDYISNVFKGTVLESLEQEYVNASAKFRQAVEAEMAKHGVEYS